ncbi:MAG: amidohydrolase [Chloroflexi bacterium]|nr:amidohydrolase [Chloroflexota bacterium]
MTPPFDAQPIVDCDIHNTVPNTRALFPYLSEFWRETVEQSGFKGPVDDAYPANAPTSAIPGSRPEGGRPGSSLALVQQHLDAWNVRVGILNCAYAVDGIHNPYGAEAFARAANDWQIEHWLEKEPRLRASVVVPVQHPDLAAAEIRRVGGHAGFVQVLLPVRAEAPYGNRRYLPIFEAALEQDLVVSLQFGGAPGNPPTAGGWPTYYVEEYAGMAQVAQSQLMSLIAEGVFDRFPELRVVCVETGWTWLPAFLWRLDKEWKGLRREVPWVKRAPSEYVLDRVRFTLQPTDAPDDRRMLHQVFDQLGSDDLLLFSTDYPHWQFDAPDEALPLDLPAPQRRKILSENAHAFYRLEHRLSQRPEATPPAPDGMMGGGHGE